MSRHKGPNPRHPKSSVPDIAASDAGGLVKRGVDLGLIRDAVVDNIDRPGVFPLGPLLTARDVSSSSCSRMRTPASTVEAQP